MPTRDLKLTRRRLTHEHQLRRRTGIDEIHPIVPVKIKGDHRRHPMADRQLLPTESPMLRKLVDTPRRDDFILGRRAGLLVVHLNPAGVVVDHDQVKKPVPIDVRDRHRSRVAADLDHLQPLEAVVFGEARLLPRGRTDQGPKEPDERQTTDVAYHGAILAGKGTQG